MKTSEEIKHTATPWKIRKDSFSDRLEIESSDGLAAIAKLIGYGDATTTPRVAKTHEEYAANAAFIVRAVNAHDALVNALRRIDNEVDEGLTVPDGVMLEIRKALAMAEGKGE